MKRSHLLVLMALAFASPVKASAAETTLTVYSSRHYPVDKELNQRFTAATGIKIEVLEGKGDELNARLEAEGDKTPADVLLSNDAAAVERARHYLAALPDSVLASVASGYKAEDKTWVAVSSRARAIVYRADSPLPAFVKNYEDLASPALKGMLCSRASDSPYNRSLLASILAANGAEKTLAWVKGYVANFARDPQGNDKAQIRDVVEGRCKAALVNTYYLAQMRARPDGTDVSSIKVLFPNQDNRGTHVNISGAAVVKASAHKKAAEQFVAFLLSAESQGLVTNENFEYPVLASVKTPDALKDLVGFKADTAALPKLGALIPEALKIADQGGWK
jgi:iron(III) transport system substrate-binding protein